jgi:hypothetical protein
MRLPGSTVIDVAAAMQRVEQFAETLTRPTLIDWFDMCQLGRSGSCPLIERHWETKTGNSAASRCQLSSATHQTAVPGRASVSVGGWSGAMDRMSVGDSQTFTVRLPFAKWTTV